jgi:hypothetical protein
MLQEKEGIIEFVTRIETVFLATLRFRGRFSGNLQFVNIILTILITFVLNFPFFFFFFSPSSSELQSYIFYGLMHQIIPSFSVFVDLTPISQF